MTNKEISLDIPVVPLRDMVIYPHGVHPLFVGTQKSILALESAMAGDKQVLLVAKRDASVDDPSAGDLYGVGTLSTVLQLLKLPDGTVKVLIEGGARATIERYDPSGDFWVADVGALREEALDEASREALNRSVMSQFERYVQALSLIHI